MGRLRSNDTNTSIFPIESPPVRFRGCLLTTIVLLLLHAGAHERELMALAAGSTIAGNLLILGAASNIIVIQNAEQRSHHSVTFLEFPRIGIPFTLAQTASYWAYLKLWPA